VTTPVVLGIDPQSKRLGLALVEFEPPFRALWADTVSISDKTSGLWQYQQIGAALRNVPATLWVWDGKAYQSTASEIVRVGIELPPYVNNRAVFRGLSIVYGLVGAECHRRWPWAPQIDCDVQSWKRVVLGKGGASKAEVMEWACSQYPYGGPVISSQDSADALAIATYAAGVVLEGEAA